MENSDVKRLQYLIFEVIKGDFSTIKGIVNEKNNAINHPLIKLKDNNEELIHPMIIPINKPYLQPCNSGLERSSKPIVGNKENIKEKNKMGNNSTINS